MAARTVLVSPSGEGLEIMMDNGVSSAALGVAQLVGGVGFLRRYRRVHENLPLTDALRYVVAVLSICVLIHAGDALSLYLPSQSAFAAVSVPVAVAALAAVSGTPRFLRALTARRASVRRREASGAETVRRLADENERYERLRARVLDLEDTLRRDAWVRQSRQAVRQLNEMLDDRPYKSGRSTEGGPG